MPTIEQVTSDRKRHATLRKVAWIAAPGVLLLGFAILLQFTMGAYRGEFGGFPDESAHYVTGLMIRDYIASGCPVSPIEYAENYYIHYPKVAFGMWGPLLHVIEGGWLLAIPPSRISMMVLMALIASVTATLLFDNLRKEFGAVLALAAAMLFLANPVVHTFTGMVMADGLVGLMDFAAAMCFGLLLDNPRWKYSILFGVFTCLSILSKGNGVALAILPAFAILFARKWGLLKKPVLWAGTLVVICIAGPWQVYSARMLSGIVDRQFGWIFAPFYTELLFTITGLAFLPPLFVGVYQRLLKPMVAGRTEGKWAAAGGLVCSVWFFHCLIPASAPEARYYIAVVAPLLMFIVAGVQEIAGWIPIVWPLRQRSWAVMSVLSLVVVLTAAAVPKKLHHGYDTAAELLEQPENQNAVVLISSESDGEGMLISEITMREKRPAHFVLRATKMLSESNWVGMRYELQYRTPEEILKFLNSVPVEVVVIDNTPSDIVFPHHALLKQAMQTTGEWKKIATIQGDPPLSTIDVYRVNGRTGKRNPIRINLPYTLGRRIER
jgi:hypothetical protein